MLATPTNQGTGRRKVRGMVKICLTVNGVSVNDDVPDNMLLVDFIRERLKLTGTHVGCDTSQCGACVIHLDGESVKS
ncbi:MAG: 2Fe-2S iron-sulfur cluster-binding protein, partial [Alphaproteobacteria bacterium]